MAKNSNTYRTLAKKWIDRHKQLQEELWASHGDVIHDFVNGTKSFAISSISGLMLLSSPAAAGLLPPSTSLAVQDQKFPVESDKIGIDKSVFLVSDLSSIVPGQVRPLTLEEENSIGQILTRDFGLKVSAELSGIRLNRSYGYIGAEQHLMRYPGDNIYTHFDNSSDTQEFGETGMAPGLGGWGYFASSVSSMTKEESDREKWYIAVQSFLAPGQWRF